MLESVVVVLFVAPLLSAARLLPLFSLEVRFAGAAGETRGEDSSAIVGSALLDGPGVAVGDSCKPPDIM